MPSIAIIGPVNKFDCATSFLMQQLEKVYREKGFDVTQVKMDFRDLDVDNKNLERYINKQTNEICEAIRSFDYVNLHLDQRYLGIGLSKLLKKITRICQASSKLIITLDDFPEELRRMSIEKVSFRKMIRGLFEARHIKKFWRSIAKLDSEGKAAVMLHNPVYARHFAYVNNIRTVLDHPLTFFTNADVDQMNEQRGELSLSSDNKANIVSADYLDKNSDLKFVAYVCLGENDIDLFLLGRSRLVDVEPRVPISKPIFDLDNAFGRKVKTNLLKADWSSIEKSSNNINFLKNVVEALTFEDRVKTKSDDPLPKELQDNLYAKNARKIAVKNQEKRKKQEVKQLLSMAEDAVNKHINSKIESETVEFNKKRNVKMPGFKNLEQVAVEFANADATVLSRLPSWEHSSIFLAIAAQFSKKIFVSHIPIHHHLREYWGEKINYFDLGNSIELKQKLKMVKKSKPSTEKPLYDLTSYVDLQVNFFESKDYKVSSDLRLVPAEEIVP